MAISKAINLKEKRITVRLSDATFVRITQAIKKSRTDENLPRLSQNDWVVRALDAAAIKILTLAASK